MLLEKLTEAERQLMKVVRARDPNQISILKTSFDSL